VSNFICDDAGSGGDHDLSTWEIAPLAAPIDSKVIYLTSGSFCPNSSGSQPFDSLVANALAVQFPTVQNNAQPILPRLTNLVGPENVVIVRDNDGNPLPASIAYIPCTQVKDEAYRGRLTQQVAETPFYSLEKYVIYRKESCHTNQSGTSGKFTFTYTTGTSTTDSNSIAHTIGVSLTVGYEAGIEVEGIGAKASASITSSYSLGLTSETARTLSEEKQYSVEYDVPANGIGCLFIKSYLYKLKRSDGSELREWIINSEDTHYSSYAG